MSSYKIFAVIALFAGAAACGGSDPKPSKKQKAAAKRRQQQKPQSPRGKGKATLASYPKVEDLVPNYVRPKFTSALFIPDPSGRESRDPYRSPLMYVPEADDGSGTKEITERCSRKEQFKATSESINNLTLSGIIRRTGRSIAMFRDPRMKMYLIQKGDCVGTEKAKVTDVKSGYVKVEILPPSTKESDEIKPRLIPLHPDADDGILSESDL